MALVKCGDADVLRGRVHLPQRGAWYLEAALDTATAPAGTARVAADGGFTLTGAIVRSGVDTHDTALVRVVGGAGGLGTIIPAAAYANALLGDPLRAALSAAGETLSSTTDAAITNVLLSTWTHVAQRAAAVLDLLAFAAGRALGKSILWRVLADGTVWLGEETWPSAKLPAGADVLEIFPAERRVELGVETPALLPGVNLDGVGNVAAVDHWIEHDHVRTDAWLA